MPWLWRTHIWSTSIRRSWEEGLVWRFGWARVVDIRYDTVELCGPMQTPS
jgi:hypothetical protein